MNDSEKAKVCLQRIVDLFKEGNIPKALAVAIIPPQSDIPSAKWSICPASTIISLQRQLFLPFGYHNLPMN